MLVGWPRVSRSCADTYCAWIVRHRCSPRGRTSGGSGAHGVMFLRQEPQVVDACVLWVSVVGQHLHTRVHESVSAACVMCACGHVCCGTSVVGNKLYHIHTRLDTTQWSGGVDSNLTRRPQRPFSFRDSFRVTFCVALSLFLSTRARTRTIKMLPYLYAQTIDAGIVRNTLSNGECLNVRCRPLLFLLLQTVLPLH